MPTPKTVLAICGSTRAQSSNLNLIKALAELAEGLLETLMVIEAKMVEESKLLIPFIKTKINAEGVITNTDTLNEVKNLIQAFFNLIEYSNE